MHEAMNRNICSKCKTAVQTPETTQNVHVQSTDLCILHIKITLWCCSLYLQGFTPIKYYFSLIEKTLFTFKILFFSRSSLKIVQACMTSFENTTTNRLHRRKATWNGLVHHRDLWYAYVFYPIRLFSFECVLIKSNKGSPVTRIIYFIHFFFILR